MFSNVVLIWIEPPTNHNITEGVDQTVEYCVVVSVPDMNATIQCSDFSVCLSTVHRVKCFSILIEYLSKCPFPTLLNLVFKKAEFIITS